MNQNESLTPFDSDVIPTFFCAPHNERAAEHRRRRPKSPSPITFAQEAFRMTSSKTALTLFSLLLMFQVSKVISFSPFVLGRFSRVAVQANRQFGYRQTTAVYMSTRKAGVAEPTELQQFVQAAGDRLVVADVRNPDASAEPGDQKSLEVAPLPSKETRPQALHLIWDRDSKSMPLPDVAKDTPIITHCGGGGRGQKAKDFLEEKGFTKVLNGGGPKETDCWAEFGSK
jgi:rhodanese-related sulfurtransferase